MAGAGRRLAAGKGERSGSDPPLRARGFSDEVVTAIDCLTRRNGELYEAFIERAASDAIARCVKLADVEDNLDVRRLPDTLTEADRDRLDRYRRAWIRLSR